ncbi:ent-kaurenoic acid oxidase 1-like [Senna tora]|uniref:Ent-kaurenoic acid oxidase 1-like n=1 Tax=Senna tora TaxID=362788 RepID=A0A834WD35_9FABA|nr:ent-kaurenoic acid oxidase 1-like [Senna tora]
MQIRDDEGNLLSDKQVVDNIVSLIVAGYVSTALVSMWAIYYLAKFPRVLTKLRERKKFEGFSNLCFAMVYAARGDLDNDDGAEKDGRYSDENDLNPRVRRKAKRKVLKIFE